MTEQLVDTWLINNRVNLILLSELTQEGLQSTLSTRGGRTVGQQLAHVYDVRRRRLELADKDLLENLPAISREKGHDKALLTLGFETSGMAVAELIRQSAEDGGRVRNFPRGIVALTGYLIAHEAHHRGGILLTLKQSGIRRSDRLKWGIWDWNKI